MFQRKKETGLLGYSCHEGIKSKEVLNSFIGLSSYFRDGHQLSRRCLLARCVDVFIADENKADHVSANRVIRLPIS